MSGGSRGIYGKWQTTSLQEAVKSVLMYKWSAKRAGATHGVPRSTLQRYLKQCMIDGGVEKKAMGRQCTMTEQEESELCNILLEMEGKLYGLSPGEVRKVVYEFCDTNKIPHSFNDEKKTAGRKWLNLFIERHPELSIRKAEGVSLQRASGYNISKIRIFENILKTHLFAEDGKRKIPVENIFNVDETGVTVNQKPKKVVARKGKKSIGVVTSLEKGKTITAVCCVSATGAYCPPFLIFPRKRFKDELMDRGPSGAVGVANGSGWINEEVFLQWFEHFLNFYQPKHRSSPCLLLMDGHTSHTNNLRLVMKARENNVELLVLPSHCTHKIQPLDVSVFKSLKSHYDKAVDAWLHAHPGRGVQEANVAELFGEAWGKAATVANAVSGFRKSRIHPFAEADSDDEDFRGADVTDVAQAERESVSSPAMQPANVDVAEPSSSTTPVTEAAAGREQQQATTTLIASSTPVPDSDADGNAQLPVIVVPEPSKSPAMPPANVDRAEPSPSSTASVPEVATDRTQPQEIITIQQPSSRSPESNVRGVTMRNLIPTPKAARVSRGKREVSHARMLTDSPYKRKLEVAAEEKKMKEEAKKFRAAKLMIAAEEKQRKEEAKKCRAAKKTHIGIVKPTEKEKQMKQKAKNKTVKRNRKKNAETEDDAHCLYCNETYSASSETWFQCQGSCSKWSHMSCAGLNVSDVHFVCELCQ